MKAMKARRVWSWIPAAIVCCAVSASFAKLPAPPPVDPAKAEEAKQKAAEAAKKARAAEEAAMDRVVARYKKEKGMAMASAPAKAGAAAKPATPDKKK
jgi:hypothetical protein